MPLQQTSGNVTADAYGGGVAVVPNYIEDVFSTWLYSGNDASQTVNNGIDLSTKGGLVWIKSRNLGGTGQFFQDTVRGANQFLDSTTTGANQNISTVNTTFTTTGFTQNNNYLSFNGSSYTYASWTFRKQPKFFDVVTYTGDGNQKVLSHNLGSAPGFIIAKATSTTGDWAVWHRSTTFKQGYLNTTADFTSAVSNFPTNAGTSTTFTVNGPPSGGILSDVGVTYVAYLFAHNAGGFGLTGTDNVISCGSYTSTGNNDINLGYEPQFIIEKRASGVSDWHMWDTMRGMSQTNLKELEANTSAAEVSFSSGYVKPTATGYNNTYWSAGETIIYIAIRRGPMKVPTDGTTVYNGVTRSGNSTATTVTGVGFAPDLVFEAARTNSGGNNWIWFDRLRGGAAGLSSDNTGAEFTNSAVIQSDSLSTTMDGFRIQTVNPINASGNTYVYYPLKRAPGFFDEVCYTGTGSATTVAHNLAVAPEMIITKARSSGHWQLYVASLGNTYTVSLNGTFAAWVDTSIWNSTNPTTSVFSVGSNSYNNNTAYTYVAYLFATCPGVSKVGSYTGTGATQTISCGFTGGARFVLIKRTDATGDWYVYDTARGMTVLTDPYLLMNSTAAEVATLGSVTTTTGGFTVNASILAAINTNGASYIYLSIA